MTVSVLTAAPRRRVLRRLLKNSIGVGSIAVLATVIVLSIGAPLFTAFDPNYVDVANISAGPAPGHPLGFDASGRDTWSRLLFGGRTSLSAAGLAVLTAAVIGTPLGLYAGYYRGILEGVASWTSNVIQSVPGIIVLLVVAAGTANNYVISMITLGVLLSPGFYRLTRATVIAVRDELYVDAARVSGLSDRRIIRRHLLGVIRGPVLIQSALTAGLAINIQGGLEFLGLGLPGVPSWGGMLNDAFKNIFGHPELLVAPGVAIGSTVAALALLGSALSDAYASGQGATAPQHARVRRRRSSRRPGAPCRQVPPPEVLLVVDGLRVAYGDREVVHDISLQVGRGEVVGLVGESGSGKTQTAFSVLGLLPRGATVSSRSMWLDGRELSQMPSAAREELLGTIVGYIPQEPMANLDPSFTIGYQLTMPLRRRLGLSRQAAWEKAATLLSRVGIVDPERTMRCYPHEISGGMAQRVLIAGAISLGPSLLIADEPTTALDVTVQAEVLDVLRDLQKDFGMGILIVTHNLGVVADLCDRVYVMRSGEIVETAPVRQLLRSPQHSYTRELLAASLESAPSRTELDRDAKEATRV